MAGDKGIGTDPLKEVKAPDIDWGMNEAPLSVRYMTQGNAFNYLNATGAAGNLGKFIGSCKVEILQGDLGSQDIGKKAAVSQFVQPADWHAAHVSSIDSEKHHAILTVDDCNVNK